MYLNYRLVLLLGLLHHLCGHVGGQDILLVVSVHIHQNVRERLPDPETIEIDSKLKKNRIFPKKFLRKNDSFDRAEKISKGNR